jgi:hypothetical protein
MIMIVWLCLLAALAGVLNPVQSGANGEMGRVLGNPFGVVLLSLSVSLAFTLVAGLLTRSGDISGFGRLMQRPGRRGWADFAAQSSSSRNPWLRRDWEPRCISASR